MLSIKKQVVFLYITMKPYTHISLKVLLCLFACVIFATAIYGQNSDFQHKKDSLLKVIASTQGEEKLNAHEELAGLRLPEEELDLKLQYINDFIRETRKQQNTKREISACRSELVCLHQNSRFDEFNKKANEYLPIFKKNGYYEDYYEIYSFQLRLLGTSGNNKQGMIEETKRMYAEAKQENCLYGIAQATMLIAEAYNMEKRHEEAEKYFRETIKNALQLIKKEPNQITNYDLVSNAYNCLMKILLTQKRMNEFLSLMSDWEKHTITFEEIFGHPDPFLVFYYKYCALIYIEEEKYDKAELYCDSMSPIIPPLGLDYIWEIKLIICEKRKEYDKAIDWLDKIIEHGTIIGEADYVTSWLMKKGQILSKMKRAEDAAAIFEKVIQRNDSLRQLENNAQLDEIRTQYEVDKYIAEKERNFNYFLFAIGSCILLVIALGIWIYLNRKITQKNRTLAQQIKELITQQEELIKETLDKTLFMPVETLRATSLQSDLCIESRMDKLCVAIRDLLLKNKIYRNPAITQELVIETLGTNRRAFSEALEFCLKMKFNDYVNFLRLKDAVQLLEQSDLSMEEISDMVGFGTARTFRNQFSTKYDMTPKDYRNSIKIPNSHSERREEPPAILAT